MDPPTGEEYDAVREQKAGLLKSVRPLDPAHVVRGQYADYQSVPGVKPGSTVETFVAAKLFINSWRWADVPIYIRAGKALSVTAAEVMVYFKRPPEKPSRRSLRRNPDICALELAQMSASQRVYGSSFRETG